jgi:ABC-type hemin transport system ATPase subunit
VAAQSDRRLDDVSLDIESGAVVAITGPFRLG